MTARPGSSETKELLNVLANPDKSICEPAWEEWLKQYQANLTRFINFLAWKYATRGFEEDILQDTILGLMINLRKGLYDPTKSSLFGYACGIARNKSIEIRKKLSRSDNGSCDPNSVLEDWKDQDGRTPEEQAVFDETIGELRERFSQEEWRILIEKYYFDALGSRIALEKGISHTNLRQILFRCKQKARCG